MSTFKELEGGLVPRPAEPFHVPTWSTKIPEDSSLRLQRTSLPQNHSSKDKGRELKVGTSRTRRGNSRPTR